MTKRPLILTIVLFVLFTFITAPVSAEKRKWYKDGFSLKRHGNILVMSPVYTQNVPQDLYADFDRIYKQYSHMKKANPSYPDQLQPKLETAGQENIVFSNDPTSFDRNLLPLIAPYADLIVFTKVGKYETGKHHIPGRNVTYTEYEDIKIYDKNGKEIGTSRQPIEKNRWEPAQNLETLALSATFEIYETKNFDLVASYSDDRYEEKNRNNPAWLYERITSAFFKELNGKL